MFSAITVNMKNKEIPRFQALVGALAFLQVASAAQCCGWRGDNNDENTLWNTRAILCNDPLGQTQFDGGSFVKTNISLSKPYTEYAFWARDEDKQFANCWHATQQIIEQCFRNGFASGSWEWDDEIYTMSATTSKTYRRETAEAEGLPSLPGPGKLHEIELSSGLYSVMGQAVDVVLNGITLGAGYSHPRRSPTSLLTLSGPVANFTVIDQHPVDFNASIHALVRDLLAENKAGTVAKRGQQCRANSNYVMAEYGRFARFRLASPPYFCGNGNCTNTADVPVELTRGYSLNIDSSLQRRIADTAQSAGYDWAASKTADTKGLTCYFRENTCHTVWVIPVMAYQNGFALDAWMEGSQAKVGVRWIHSEAPLEERMGTSTSCNRGCCLQTVVDQHGAWDGCKSAAGKECWYGTCKDWDHNCQGVQCNY